MKTLALIKTLLLALTLVSSAIAAPMGDTGDGSDSLRSMLAKQTVLINAIQPFIEREDLPRLMALKQLSIRALQSMNESSVNHMATMQALQDLAIGYRFSKDLFRQIMSTKTQIKTLELQATSLKIIESTGLDKSPYTQVTAGVFTQIHKLFQELVQLPLSDSLKKDLNGLTPSLGRLIATAKQGDHPETFRLAKEMLVKLRTLYPQFDSIMSGEAAFYIVLEIQGLSEYYSEFSRSNEGDWS